MLKNKKANLYAVLVLIAAIFFGVLAYKVYNKPYYPPLRLPRPALGNASSPVTVIVYSDMECPACKKFHPAFEKAIDDFGAVAKFEYHHFPLTMIHDNALLAGEAAECANDQGKFWEYIDLVYKSEITDKDTLYKAASILYLDVTRFDNCVRSQTKKDIVLEEMRQAENRGLKATPTVLINNRAITALDYDSLKTEIEAEVAKFSE